MQQHWIRHLTTVIDESFDVPLFGLPPTFDFERFLAPLKLALHLEDLSLSVANQGWRSEEQLLEGLGDSPSVMALSLSPISSPIFWAISQADLLELSSWTLSPQQRTFHFQDSEIQKGYYHFLILEAIKALRDSNIYSDLSPKLETTQLTGEKSFTFDIGIHSSEKTVWGRLIVPIAFQSAIKKHYNHHLPSFLELKSKGHLFLETDLLAGYVSLTLSQFDGIKTGDFLILDYASYHPNTKKGHFQLAFASRPLLQVKLKDNHLKVLDYAFEMEGNIMNDDELSQDSQPIEDLLHEDDDLFLDDEEPPIPELSESPKEELDEEIETVQEQKMLHPKNVPLILSVEVAKIKISLDQLLQLQPGNVLNTSVQPERGVQLSLNGHIIGKGELLQIGDVLGVRIVEIANTSA
ncbi:MAG: type III secretion system cytoplasmic ring protein SctQ [Simkaniaceae bacterium]|nr:type III secretion system cytoplasmic ring protein SctQ [Simkaniaceae bacterium]